MPKLYFRLFLFSLFSSLSCYAQTLVSGYITEKDSDMPLANVHVISGQGQNTVSDIDGFFQLSLKEGNHQLHFQHLSYEIKNKNITLEKNKPLELHIELETKLEQLATVVLSAGKFEQKLEEVSVSIDVIKGESINNQHNYNVERKIAQAPGVHIIDGQINIRGGSGWSYGAGSRVLVLLDGLPVTNSSTGAVQWELIPAENIEHIEIIKGASSVLFGSSALNGVINITSKKAQSKPQTRFSTYYGAYDKAKRASLNWWTPAGIKLEEYGFNFNHARRIKNASITLGLQAHNSEGFNGLLDTTFTSTDTLVNIMHVGEQRVRIFLNTDIASKKVKGLNYGVNTSYLRFDESDGFIYLSDSLGYTPFSESAFSTFKSGQLSISPKISYNDSKRNSKHNFLGRYLQTNFNPTGDQKLNNYVALYSEYLYQKFWLNGTLSFGSNLNYYLGLSDFFDTDQKGINYALFYQYDHTEGPLRFSFGTRYERYNLRDKKEGKPVTRMGLNYEINANNFIRASIGQGYRYPSMYELFLYKDAGEISIYSNPNLSPETGFTAEIGYKHKWLVDEKATIYADLSAFHMKFNNMIEYSYGLWGDSTRLNPLGIGFKPINVGETTISGLDFSLITSASMQDWKFNTQLSYTYVIPKAVNPDEVYGNFNNRIDELIQSLIDQGSIPEEYSDVIEQIAMDQLSPLTFNKTSSNPESETLKYRYRHLAKLDLEVSKANFTFGTHLHYNSFMENVDRLFESGVFNSEVDDLFAIADANIYDMGIKQSRERFKKGDFIAHLRISYTFAKHLSMQFLVENAFNREYQLRPGSIGAPRMYSFKVSANF